MLDVIRDEEHGGVVGSPGFEIVGMFPAGDGAGARAGVAAPSTVAGALDSGSPGFEIVGVYNGDGAAGAMGGAVTGAAAAATGGAALGAAAPAPPPPLPPLPPPPPPAIAALGQSSIAQAKAGKHQQVRQVDLWTAITPVMSDVAADVYFPPPPGISDLLRKKPDMRVRCQKCSSLVVCADYR
mmetsp:Transcript_7850/g.19579  ORF Transcript_7850/g.19579 Transcript_7850/m.19579 type:complete len:183 (-) Transcript_7850:451-999(-)